MQNNKKNLTLEELMNLLSLLDRYSMLLVIQDRVTMFDLVCKLKSVIEIDLNYMLDRSEEDETI